MSKATVALTAADSPLPFGKFRGRTLTSLAAGAQDERGYVEWMFAKFENVAWRDAAGEALAEQLRVPTVLYKLDVVSTTRASLECPYDQKIVELLRSRVDGIRWNRKDERWEFTNSQLCNVLAFLSSIGDVEVTATAQLAIEEERSRRAALDNIRGRSDTDLHIPCLLALFPFQRVGVEFVLATGGRALIADEMGCGKTPQAIGASLLLRSEWGAGRVLVVCPASLKINWYREWIRFAGLEPTVWYGPKYKGDIDAQVHICNFDIFARHRARFETMGFDILVIDEAHYLKNKDTIRTQAIFGGYSRKTKKRLKPFAAPYALLLTGTPVLNRPAELFPLLHYLAPDRFTDWASYANRYGAWDPNNLGGKPANPQNLNELYQRTKDIVIRRKKIDVLKDLPPKLVSDVFVQLTPGQRSAYRTALGAVAQLWKEGAKAHHKPTLNELQILIACLNEIKLDKVRELIAELQNEDDSRSVLVFCTRLAPLKQLRDEYGTRASYIDGSMSPEARQQQVDAFQHGNSQIALLSLRAAGVGLTLTAADTVIFIDQDFVPGNHMQAEDRAHRIGQVNPVNVYYLLVEDTIDEDLRFVLASKVAVISQIADGELQTLRRTRSVFPEFVKRLKQQYRQFAGSLDPEEAA